MAHGFRNTITREAFEQPPMKRSHLQQGDVLLSIIGTVGETSLVKTQQEATCSCKLAILRPHNIAPEYLAAYLSSTIGRSLTERWKRGAVQTGLLLEDMDQLPVPRLGKDLEKAIVQAVDQAYKALEASRKAIVQAETILEQSLGLDAWNPPEPLSYVCSCREAFTAERLDAEHFKPRIGALIELLKATGQAQPLSEVLTFNQRGQQPTYCEDGLPVINSKHVNRGEVRLDEDNRAATFDDRTPLIQLGDVLMNGTGVGTIGRSAPYLHQTPAVPDNHVTILRPKPGVDPVYLSVFLNSIAGQIQVEQWQRGSSGQIELYPDDIAQFLVWVAPTATQRSVKQAIESSFQEKQRSTILLDTARRAVEIAIEVSEAAALAYLAESMPEPV
jgi:type I restriction enzyme M protein